MRAFLLIVAVFVAATSASDEETPPSSLEGMQSLTVFYDTPDELSIIKIYEESSNIEIFKITGDFVEVLVAADEVDSFKYYLEDYEMSYVTRVDNIQEKVRTEHAAQEYHRGAQKRLYYTYRRLTFTYYPDYNEINSYLEYIALHYKSVAKLINIGSSFEGRAMKGLKISSGGKNKPAIFVDAGIHAREWIAPATALYIIDQLVTNQTNNALLQDVDWYFVPLLNPDGYHFTHTNVANRLWRKTRSINNGTTCRGVDGNRNFDIAWMTIGASSRPCSETYAGVKAFSEPETRNLRDFILAQNGTIKLYLTLHSYGQYILYPWGYTKKLPANEVELRTLASICAQAIASVRKTRYTYGTSANHLYPSAGGSDDWAMEKGGVDLAYTYELPGGYSGFVLPATEIKPVGTETFEAFRVMHQYIKLKYSRPRKT